MSEKANQINELMAAVATCDDRKLVYYIDNKVIIPCIVEKSINFVFSDKSCEWDVQAMFPDDLWRIAFSSLSEAEAALAHAIANDSPATLTFGEMVEQIVASTNSNDNGNDLTIFFYQKDGTWIWGYGENKDIGDGQIFLCSHIDECEIIGRSEASAYDYLFSRLLHAEAQCFKEDTDEGVFEAYHDMANFMEEHLGYFESNELEFLLKTGKPLVYLVHKYLPKTLCYDVPGEDYTDRDGHALAEIRGFIATDIAAEAKKLE